MLRITVEEQLESLSLVLEGKLIGPWVDELRAISIERASGLKLRQLTVDLCGLTSMDQRGQSLLGALLQQGATLRCSDVMNQYLIEQMAAPNGDQQEASRPCCRIAEQSAVPGKASKAAVGSVSHIRPDMWGT